MRNKKIVFEISDRAIHKIKSALIKYKEYEIGGVIVGSKITNNHFVISDVSISDEIGEYYVFNFIRETKKCVRLIINSFKKHKHSYLGEWHSHPLFTLNPSKGDIETMKGIINDPNYGVTFALLMIVKMNKFELSIGGYLFHREIERYIKANIVTSKS